MRLGELIGKEVINLTDAARLGVIKEAQALIDTEAGRVEAILVPFPGLNNIWRHQKKMLSIPWRAVRRFGRDLIVVEIKTPTREDRRHVQGEG